MRGFKVPGGPSAAADAVFSFVFRRRPAGAARLSFALRLAPSPVPVIDQGLGSILPLMGGFGEAEIDEKT